MKRKLTVAAFTLAFAVASVAEAQSLQRRAAEQELRQLDAAYYRNYLLELCIAISSSEVPTKASPSAGAATISTGIKTEATAGNKSLGTASLNLEAVLKIQTHSRGSFSPFSVRNKGDQDHDEKKARVAAIRVMLRQTAIIFL